MVYSSVFSTGGSQDLSKEHIVKEPTSTTKYVILNIILIQDLKKNA